MCGKLSVACGVAYIIRGTYNTWHTVRGNAWLLDGLTSNVAWAVAMALLMVAYCAKLIKSKYSGSDRSPVLMGSGAYSNEYGSASLCLCECCTRRHSALVHAYVHTCIYISRHLYTALHGYLYTFTHSCDT